MDIFRAGDGIDAFPATEVDHVQWARNYLFSLNSYSMRMLVIRQLMSKPLKKRRRGLSAKCQTAVNRGRAHTTGKQRLKASQRSDSYAARDRVMMQALRQRPSQRAIDLGFGRIA